MKYIHELKCWETPFEASIERLKTAEFRLNDRGFQVNDLIILQEYCPHTKKYTGREITAEITHIQEGFGIPKGYVMLSLRYVD